jgi:hypothetical protein
LRDIAGYTDKALRLLDGAAEMRRKKLREEGFQSFVADDDLVARGAFTKEEATKRRSSGLYTDEQLSGMVDRSNRYRASLEAKAASEQQRRTAIIASERVENEVYAQAYGVMGRFEGINRIRDIEIPNLAGDGTRTLSRDAIIKRVIERREEEFQDYQTKLIEVEKVDPAQAHDQVNRLRIDWYAGNGIANDQWANTLNGIGGRATTDTLLQKGEVPAYLKQSAGLYRQLKAVNPAYLSRLLTDKASKDFLEAYDRAVVYRRMPEDNALVHAATVAAQPESVKAKSLMSQSDTVELADSTLGSLGLDVRASNRAYVVDRISSLSMLGATEREIKDQIEREILETSVPINGMLVFARGDLPDDFPVLMQDALEERFQRFGETYGIGDVSDLYIAADATGTKWHVMSKSLPGMPIGAEPITTKGLEALRQRRKQEVETNVRDLARAKGKERSRLKERYDAKVAMHEKQIAYWEETARARGDKGIRHSFAEAVAKKLRERQEERITGAKWSAFKELVREQHDKDVAASQKRFDENVEFLKTFLPSVKINGRDAYEMYRNRAKFDSFGWAADTIGGWFD